jgi:hypothetical protein
MKFRSIHWIAVSVFAAGVWPSPGSAQGKIARLSGGLEAAVGFVGRDARGGQLTVSMRLLNKIGTPVQLILASRPAAIDNAGGSYQIQQFSGLAQCPMFASSVSDCMRPSVAPLDTYTQLDPGHDITLTFSFSARAEPTRATLASLSTILIYRIVQDAIADGTLSDEERRRGLRTMNLSVPDHPITDGR